MARKRSKKNKRKLIVELIIIIILIIASYFGYECTENGGFENTINKAVASLSTSNKVQVERKIVDGIMEIHTIDVGQGDSILVIQGEQVMLVDCGTRAKGDTVVKYLKNLGIEKIDILVGTHLHDDHIGGMAEVIRNFEIGTLYVPDNYNNEITTYWYIDFLDAIEEKNINCIYPTVSTTFEIGDANIKIVAPNSKEYKNMNNYSIVLMVTYGETDVILMGDAEELSEQEILKNGLYINADIIKLGHHGSNTSSSEKFLKAVNPQYAIISAGKGNTYHHPIKTVMERLENLGITVYRTDESGTIIMSTDGKNVSFNVEPGSYLSGEELNK